ncbi:MAG: hypothetical protein ACK5M3_02430 [Dysgonomonas sp.]
MYLRNWKVLIFSSLRTFSSFPSLRGFTRSNPQYQLKFDILDCFALQARNDGRKYTTIN